MKSDRAKFFQTGVYAITPNTNDLSLLVRQVEGAIKGGVRLFQYRDKVSSPDQKISAAKRLKQVIHASGGLLIINDDPYLAEMVDAAGVHIGRHDQAFERARKILGPEKIIGVSCYDNISLALSMQSEGADYVAFGAFFPHRRNHPLRRLHSMC